MNTKRFVWSVIAVCLVYISTNIVIHSIILRPTYAALAQVWRPNMVRLMWVMNLSIFIFSIMFVYIYIKGIEGKGWIEGLRYGLVVGIMMNIMNSGGQYVMYSITALLAVQWFIYGMIQFILCGLVLALIYKPLPAKMSK